MLSALHCGESLSSGGRGDFIAITTLRQRLRAHVGRARTAVPQELGHFFTMAAAPSSISAIELPRVLERRWWRVVF